MPNIPPISRGCFYVADYVIGDIQGCYEPLMRLLDKINYNSATDRLFFVGDLVNRGPDSLKVLHFLKSQSEHIGITLGNHDLHLLGALFGGHPWSGKDDTLAQVLEANDAHMLGHWLRQQNILIHLPEFNTLISHAGIAPFWDVAMAKAAAFELECVLKGEHYHEFLAQMYGNEPVYWSDDLEGIERLRIITNSFTRMRLCDAAGGLYFKYKGTLLTAPADLYPWFSHPKRLEIKEDIVFGHWAALMGQCPNPNIHAIDTGCYWGNTLTALRLQDKKRISVEGMPKPGSADAS